MGDHNMPPKAQQVIAFKSLRGIMFSSQDDAERDSDSYMKDLIHAKRAQALFPLLQQMIGNQRRAEQYAGMIASRWDDLLAAVARAP